MARVTKVKAGKDWPKFGIVKGEEHYMWTLRPYWGAPGVTYRSKTYPTPAQTTSNAFKQAQYGIEGDLEKFEGEAPDDLDDIIQSIRDLAEEQTEKFDNMPEGLQQGDTGQMLEQRAQDLETWATELEEAKGEWETALSVWAEADREYNSAKDAWDALSDEERAGADEPEEPEQPQARDFIGDISYQGE